ncbi:DNA-directed RNA polymerase subunit beta [Streptococcus sp. X16XC17]|uniref:DNA-directed RNA polymerase subunit beta n=1 Tax=unclassified Streptococcus TaxID=2608887 RepID=UPI00066FF547|nr:MULTISPECIES: DNA-directed RNA polymerase subunit beta [unclassified Streptococcus]TCD46549.1 DNA-directed RNA polymerase subunit beta [Streptococcus sp. X16XC17]
MDKESLSYVGRQLLLILIVLLLALMIFAAGLMIGYAVVGDGDNVWAILRPEKWQEIMGKFTGK